MKKTRNKERRKSGFALVKSMIALGLAAQMMLSSMLIIPEPIAEEGINEIDPVAVETLDEQELTIEEALSLPDESAPGDEILHDPHPASYSSDENLNPVQETQEFEQEALPGQEQPFNMTTGSGIHISVSCGEETGLSDGTSLEVIEDQLAPVSADQISGAYSLYTDPDERAYVEARLRESLLLEDWDALIMANALELSVRNDGEALVPAVPLSAELRLDMLPESMASYVSVIALDGDAAGTCLAKGMAENGGVTLRFDTYCPTRLAVCVSAKEYAYWYKEDWSFSVYGPEGTQLGCEEVSLDAGDLTVQEAQHLVCYTEDGKQPGLWLAVRPNEYGNEGIRNDAKLYALSGGVPIELLSENGFTDGPVYLGGANGFAVLTQPVAEETGDATMTEEPDAELHGYTDFDQAVSLEETDTVLPLDEREIIEGELEQTPENEEAGDAEEGTDTDIPGEYSDIYLDEEENPFDLSEDENAPIEGETENLPVQGENEDENVLTEGETENTLIEGEERTENILTEDETAESETTEDETTEDETTEDETTEGEITEGETTEDETTEGETSEDGTTDGETENTPADGESENTPVESEGENTLAESETENLTIEGEDENIPADGETENTPAESETVNTPAEGEGENAPAEGEGENVPTDGETENTPDDSETVNTPTEGEGENASAEGEGENVPTDGETENTPVDDESENYIENIETGTDVLSLSGSVPEGVAANAEDALDQVADLDLAQLERAQPGAEENEAEQESLPAYRVLTAWTLNLTRDSEAWQPDEDHPLTASISHEEINAARDLQLWHVRYDEEGNPRPERIRDFTIQENALSFPVMESGLYMISCTAGFRSEAVTVTGDELPAGISAAMRSVDFDASQLSGLSGQSADEVEMFSFDTQSFNAPAFDLRQSLSVMNTPLDISPDAALDAEQPNEAEETGKTGARYEVITAYDISLYQDEAGYQPDAEHPLTITIRDEGIREAVQNGRKLQLWHVHEGAAPVQIESFEVNDDTVSFLVEDLSVFVVTYTVDFHWGDYTYNLAGGDTIFLSELLPILIEGADKANEAAETQADDTIIYNTDPLKTILDDMSLVENVTFSDPSLVQVDEVLIIGDAYEEANGYVEDEEKGDEDIVLPECGTDWRLWSLSPFETEETLTITLTTGEQVEILVTDIIYGDDDGETVTGNARRVTADGVTYNLNGAYADVYAYSNGCTIHNQIVYNGSTYTVRYANAGVGYATFTKFNKIRMDAELIERAAGYSFDLPEMKTDITAAEKTALLADGFVAGDSNDSSDYKVWKKAVYNPDTNSIDFTMKYFQALKENVPLDFIFIYDDSISMFDASRWAPVATPADQRQVRIVEAQGTRIIILEAAKALLSDAANNGYDIRVAAGGAADGDTSNSVEANNGGWYGPGDYDDLEEYLATYHGGPRPNTGGVTDHVVGANNAYYMAKASHEAGRTPIVIYLSDFVDGGGAAAFRQRVKPLMDQIHGWGKVYGLKTIGLGDNFRTDTICTDNNHLYFMRDEFPEGVKQLEVIIKDAIGYYMKDKVTVTDNLSEALSGITPGTATKDEGTVTQSAGKSTWTLGGTSPYPGAGAVYTESFSVPLDDETVHAGSMPTNGQATVTVGGSEENKIEPADNAPDKLHLAQDMVIYAAMLDEKGRTQADTAGMPFDTVMIKGVNFTLQEAEQSGSTFTPKSGSSPVTYTTDGNGLLTIPYLTGDKVTLRPGSSYLLTELESSVQTYNSSASTKLVCPDKSWVIKVADNGIVTITVNGDADQTPKATVAKAQQSDSTATPPVVGHPARFVLWNQIVVPARLIPITVQKVWHGGVQHPTVNFRVYGVDMTTKARTADPLPVYSQPNVESARVSTLSGTDQGVTVTQDSENDTITWSKTVYVPDKISENGTDFKLYDYDIATLEELQTLDNEPGITLRDGAGSTAPSITPQGIIEKYGTVDPADNVRKLFFGESYSYDIEEDPIYFEDGWYAASSSDETKERALVGNWQSGSGAYEGWETYGDATSTDFQFRLNIRNYYYGGTSSTDVQNFYDDFNVFRLSWRNRYAYITTAATIGNFYTRLKTVTLTVTDTNVSPNKQYILTLTPGSTYTGDRAAWQDSAYGGVVFRNIRVPQEWESYAHPGNQQKIRGLRIDNISVTSNANRTYRLYPVTTSWYYTDQYGSFPYGPQQSDLNFATQISRLGGFYGTQSRKYYKLNDVAGSTIQVYERHPAVSDKNIGQFVLNQYALELKNTWTPNPLTELQITKNWVNAEGGAIPSPQQKNEIELTVQGSSSAGTKAIQVFKVDPNAAGTGGEGDEGGEGEDNGPDTDDWSKFLTVSNPLSMTGTPSASSWEKSYYVPTYDMDTFQRDASGEDHVEEFAYTVSETPLQPVEEEGRDGVPGTWTKDTVYTEPQSDVPGVTVPAHWDSWTYTGTNTWYFALRIQKPSGGNPIFNLDGIRFEFSSRKYKVTAELNRSYSLEYSDYTNKTLYFPFELPDNITGNNINPDVKEIKKNGNWYTAGTNTGVTSYAIQKTQPNNGVRVSSSQFGDARVASATYEEWKEAVNIPAQDSVPATVTITNTYTPNKLLTVNTSFTDNSTDVSSTGLIKTVHYAISDGTSSYALNVPISDKAGSWGIYLPGGTYTVTQTGYTLSNGTSVDLTSGNNPYTTTVSGSMTQLTDTVDMSADNTVDFLNDRKILPIRVQTAWEPVLQTGEDPITDSGTSIEYKLSYLNAATGESADLSSGAYRQTANGTTQDKNGAFELSSAAHINDHNNVPTYSVTGVLTDCTVTGDSIAAALPDYEADIEQELKTIGTTETLVFTLTAHIKRAPIRVQKVFDEHFSFDAYKGATLTYTVTRSDGQSIYGSSEPGISMQIIVPTDEAEMAVGLLGTFTMNDSYSSLNAETRAAYSATDDTIYLPVLRSYTSANESDVKYVVTEKVENPVGNELSYFPVFADADSHADNQFSQTNPRGRNDRDDTVYGPQNKANFRLTENGILIRVGNADMPYICKIFDGQENPFRTLNDAVAYARSYGNGQPMGADNPVKIEMLVDYMIPSTDTVTLDQAADNIIITTAATSGGVYNFVPTFTPEQGRSTTDSTKKSILKRGANNSGSMFTVEKDASFTTKNIILDGGAVFETGTYMNGEVVANGGIINTSGSLTLNEGTALQNTAVKKSKEKKYGQGGAVYVSATGTLNVTGKDSNKVTITNCKSEDSGGAIFSLQDASSMSVSYADFSNGTAGNAGGFINIGNVAKADEAVPYDLTVTFDHCNFTNSTANGTVDGCGSAIRSLANTMSLDTCEFSNCSSKMQGGAIFHKGGTSFTANNCDFTSCRALGIRTAAGVLQIQKAAGALETQAVTVNLTDVDFTNCSSTRNAGALNVYNTSATFTLADCDFVNCHTLLSDTNNDSGFGGAFRTTGLETNLTDCTFTNCQAAKGGAICCNGNSNVTTIQVTNPAKVTFDQCSATEKGGAIYQVGGKLNIEGGIIQNCYAPNGGGVYQGGGECHFKGGRISNCAAVKVTATESNNVITVALGNDNNMDYLGGGVYLGSGKFYIDGTESSIYQCKAITKGGGIYLGAGTFTLTSGSIDQCAAKEGGGIYAGSGATMTITKSGEAIKSCAAKNVSASGTSASSVITTAAASVSGNNGGGVYLYGGKPTVTATIIDCEAYNGGGIYIAGTGELVMGDANSIITGCSAACDGGGIYQSAGKLTITNGKVKANTAADKGGGIYLADGVFTINGGTVGGVDEDDGNGGTVKNGNNAANGGGIYQNGGTLTINNGNILGNKASANGGAIYLEAGTFTLKAGEVGNTTDNGAGNEAVNGGGLFVENGARASILGGILSGNNATGLGGGIAVGGVDSRLYFAGSIQVWNNWLKNGTADPVRCDVVLDFDTNEIINTTADGLNEESHIGIYVTDKEVTVGTETTTLFEIHGKGGKPFGTFVQNETAYDRSLNRFINNRSGTRYNNYEYYYGVRKPYDGDPNIYWAEYVCEITDSAGNLLFTNKTATAPALYQYLGHHGAFEALNLQFYDADGKDATPVYVKMLVNSYDLKWERTVSVPSKIITLTMCAADDGNYSDEAGHYNGYCLIGRGDCTTSMFTTAAGSDFTVENIVIDGGATYDTETQRYGGRTAAVAGGLINAGGDLTINACKDSSNNYHAVLQNSVTTENGGAIAYSGAGTFTMGANALIERCKSVNGAVLYVNSGKDKIVTMSNIHGAIEDCEAVNGLIYVNSGALLLSGTMTNETGTNVCTVTNCTVTNGGAVYVEDGTLNLRNTTINGLSATDGGAIYQNGGTVNIGQDMGRNKYENLGNITNCEASNHGGAIYHRAGNLKLFAGDITGNKATENGGAVYHSDGTANLYGATLSTNEAKIGAGVFVADNARMTFGGWNSSRKATVSGNIASEKGGGIATGTGSTLNFQGYILVQNNTMPKSDGTGTVNCNVYLDQDSDAIINQTNDIKLESYIGVYASDDAIPESSDTVNDRHGNSGQTFGTLVPDANGKYTTWKNERFINDRLPYLYGVRDTADNSLDWVTFVCKITTPGETVDERKLLYKKTGDDEYSPAVYNKLGKGRNEYDPEYAFNTLLTGSTDLYTKNGETYTKYTGSSYWIQMLVEEYTWTKWINIGKTVTLTTATKSEKDGFSYNGPDGTYATIKRSTSVTEANQKKASMFTVRGNFTVQNIVLDGNNAPDVTDNGTIIVLKNDTDKATVTIGENAMLKNGVTTGDGGAIWASPNSGKTQTINITGGTIKDNTALNGAGIYAGDRVTVNISGSPVFSDNYSSIDFTSGDKNGGEDYQESKYRQDIYIPATDGIASTITVNGPIGSAQGSIWVWAPNGGDTDAKKHYRENDQFAVFGGAAVSGGKVSLTVSQQTASMAAFRNARADRDTTDGGTRESGDYLFGVAGANANYIYWGTEGEVVFFNKVDGYGDILAGAKFSLWKDSAATGEAENIKISANPGDPFTVSAKEAESLNKADAEKTESKKNVNFKIANGVYYMKEVTAPTGFTAGNTKYIVLVGSSALTITKDANGVRTGIWASNAVLQDIQEGDIKAQTGTGTNAVKFAIFKIENDKAVVDPNIASFGIMNNAGERKVILRKVNNTYASLQGAQFQIYRYDGTQVSSNNQTTFTSGANGVYFIDTLPFGVYYLHELTAPTKENGTDTNAYSANAGRWFYLVIGDDTAAGSRDGVRISTSYASRDAAKAAYDTWKAGTDTTP